MALTWIERTAGAPGGWLSAGGYNGSRVCLIGARSSVVSDDDGATWAASALDAVPGGSGITWRDIIYVNSLSQWLAIADDRWATSSTGLTWAGSTFGATWTPHRVVHNGTRYIMASNNAMRYYNGSGWVTATCPDVTWEIYGRSLVMMGSTAVVLSDSGQKAYHSTDGINWTAFTLTFSGDSTNYPSFVYRLVWTGTRLIGFDRQQMLFISSADGKHFVEEHTAFSDTLHPLSDVAHCNGLVIGGTSDAGMLPICVETTDYGATTDYSGHFVTSNAYVLALVALTDRFVAVLDSGRVATSSVVSSTPTGITTLGIEIIATDGEAVTLGVEVIAYDPALSGATTLGIEIAAYDPTTAGATTLGIEIITQDGDYLDGSLTVADPAGMAARWQVRAWLEGADVTDHLLGQVKIEMEENAARVADLTLLLDAGPMSPTAYVGRQLAITIEDARPGYPLNRITLFTGRIITPTLSMDYRSLAIIASDGRQDAIAAMPAAALDALTPDAYWSSAVFKTTTVWQRALDRLSTLQGHLDLAPDGSMRYTPWAAKAVPDLTFTDTHLVNGRPQIALAERNSLTNRVTITFGYRFPRLKAEGYVLNYDPLALNTTAFIYWVDANNAFLVRDQVVSAIEASGATVESINYIPLPTTPQLKPGGGAWLPNPATDGLLCLGFTGVASFDYAQTIEETHKIIVQSSDSIADIGLVQKTMSGALEGVYPDTVAVETGIVLAKAELTPIPAAETATVVMGHTNAMTPTLTPDTDRSAANNAMETLIATGKADIVSAHRAHAVSFNVPLNPAADVDKTVWLNTSRVNVRGKIRRVVHTMDPSAATAVSTITLAVSSISGVGVIHADDSIAAPAGSADGTTNALPTPVIVWNGLNGQDQQLTITFPGVEEHERQLASPTFETTVEAGFPEDLFEITL